MGQNEEERLSFTGFGMSLTPDREAEDGGVFILAVYREGTLTAAAHATERGAMQAGVEYLEDEQEESDEGGTLEDSFARAQQFLADEGGVMEIIPSPVFGE